MVVIGDGLVRYKHRKLLFSKTSGCHPGRFVEIFTTINFRRFLTFWGVTGAVLWKFLPHKQFLTKIEKLKIPGCHWDRFVEIFTANILVFEFLAVKIGRAHV